MPQKLPNFEQKDQAFIGLCQDAAVKGSSCVDDIFKTSVVMNLSRVENCNVLIILESQTAGPYYTLLFIPKQVLKPMYSTREVIQIWTYYLGQVGEERFSVTMALARGTLFGVALNGVLHWFGLGQSSDAEVKAINVNQNPND